MNSQGRRVLIQEEQDRFFKWARRFDDNPLEKRYGVADPSVDKPTSEEHMLYSDCPLKLHNMHYDKWPPVALRTFLTSLEKMEGKC
jgi:hypothetical protein